jgi:hypothetical protein
MCHITSKRSDWGVPFKVDWTSAAVVVNRRVASCLNGAPPLTLAPEVPSLGLPASSAAALSRATARPWIHTPSRSAAHQAHVGAGQCVTDVTNAVAAQPTTGLSGVGARSDKRPRQCEGVHGGCWDVIHTPIGVPLVNVCHKRAIIAGVPSVWGPICHHIIHMHGLGTPQAGAVIYSCKSSPIHSAVSQHTEVSRRTGGGYLSSLAMGLERLGSCLWESGVQYRTTPVNKKPRHQRVWETQRAA